MREKELRLALVCYGGVSLAVYMHGITKEIWRLVSASRAYHAAEEPGEGSHGVYHRLFTTIAAESDIHLRVLADILAGASAGGINAVFLAQAISSGQSLDPLTQLWLDHADIEALADEDGSMFKRMARSTAIPFAWALSSRSQTVDETVDPEQRAEVRGKLAQLVRSPWFAPPFGGPAFTRLLLDAFDAMAAAPCGPALLPDYQPLDLFVTVTDFRGYPQRLRLNSPPVVTEKEHKLLLSFRDSGGTERSLADAAELVFAARATASFPGAFPPFEVGELDKVLEERHRDWPERAAFLARSLPRRNGIEKPEQVVLIDGSLLANAPFRPCMQALRSRPARREVDRRFVYIDPSPGRKSVRLTTDGETAKPGFFATIFGAMSDIPREQPIRDNLEMIERRSNRIRRMRRIVEAMKTEVEAAIERAFGSSFFLASASVRRLQGWRSDANRMAAKEAGFAYASYAHLKLSAVIEESVLALTTLGGTDGDPGEVRNVRDALWAWATSEGLSAPDAATAKGASEPLILFYRNFDVDFRIRRLRLLAREMSGTTEDCTAEEAEVIERARGVLYRLIARYEAPLTADMDAPVAPFDRERFAAAAVQPQDAMAALADRLGLKHLDDETDQAVADALADLPRARRRAFILTYLGYPFYDIATLPLLQGEGLQEFDPIKVDRISPDDATAIRKGGTLATLKGIQFNNFGAFFSRAYRENDYLWGRLHGADRLIDIVVSTLPQPLAPEVVTEVKRDAFRAIVAEERGRLKAIGALFAALDGEIG